MTTTPEIAHDHQIGRAHAEDVAEQDVGQIDGCSCCRC